MTNVKESPKGKSALKVDDKDGHAVVSVDVPAHTAEVSVAHSAIPGCAVAAVEAWDKVRNVEGGDADFAHSLESHRRDLVYHAEAIYKGGSVAPGDSTIARFEQEVIRIKGRQDKEAEAVAKKAAPAA